METDENILELASNSGDKIIRIKYSIEKLSKAISMINFCASHNTKQTEIGIRTILERISSIEKRVQFIEKEIQESKKRGD